MYIEKIVTQKIYCDDQKALDKMGLKKNCAEDTTANQQCKIKVRAVGLDYKVVTKWLEQKEQQDQIRDLINICESNYASPAQVKQAQQFVGDFKEKLA